MRITIELDTLRTAYGPSWEKLQDLLRSCMPIDDNDNASEVTLTSIERVPATSGNYRASIGKYLIHVKQGEQGYAGSVTVEK